MPARYVQNHVFDPVRIETLHLFLADRDLVTEIWFEDVQHLKASTQTPYYRTVLQPDESNFVDQASVLKAVVLEREAWGNPSADAVKLFVFLKRCEHATAAQFDHATAAQFDDAWHALSRQDMESSPLPLAFMRNTPLPGPDGTPPFVDGVAEFWFSDKGDAETFCIGTLAPLLTGDAAAMLDAKASFYVLAHEYDVARLRATAAVPA